MIKKTVIIPEFHEDEDERSFLPHIIKIETGDTVRWINKDKESHFLFFFNIDETKPKNIKLLYDFHINPGQSKELRFNYEFNRIDCICKNHKNEIHSVIIFKKNTEMTNTERLQYLNRKFDIIPPDLYKHLDGNK
ncbi:MAG: cupredoxin domain-containing protein [Nitrososphaeraceae archaeon]